MHTTIIRLPDELHTALVAEAQALGLSLAAYVRLLLAGELTRPRGN